jgi:hypothetical protein
MIQFRGGAHNRKVVGGVERAHRANAGDHAPEAKQKVAVAEQGIPFPETLGIARSHVRGRRVRARGLQGGAFCFHLNLMG